MNAANKPLKLSLYFRKKHIAPPYLLNIERTVEVCTNFFKADKDSNNFSDKHWTIILESEDRFLRNVTNGMVPYQNSEELFITGNKFKVVTMRRRCEWKKDEIIEVLVGPKKRLVIGIKNQIIFHLEGHMDGNPFNENMELKFHENCEYKIEVLAPQKEENSVEASEQANSSDFGSMSLGEDSVESSDSSHSYSSDYDISSMTLDELLDLTIYGSIPARGLL